MKYTFKEVKTKQRILGVSIERVRTLLDKLCILIYNIEANKKINLFKFDLFICESNLKILFNIFYKCHFDLFQTSHKSKIKKGVAIRHYQGMKYLFKPHLNFSPHLEEV